MLVALDVDFSDVEHARTRYSSHIPGIGRARMSCNRAYSHAIGISRQETDILCRRAIADGGKLRVSDPTAQPSTQFRPNIAHRTDSAPVSKCD